jgi:hypothetical protein
VDCKQPLEACQGYIKAWYFRHQTTTDCKGGPMTALHLMAQFLLKGSHSITTRDEVVSYSNGVMESPLANSKYQIDVAAEKADKTNFLIEIFVNHRIEADKADYIKSQKIHCVEIDLSNISPDIKREDLYPLLTNDVSIQRIVYSPHKNNEAQISEALDNQQKSKSWLEGLIPFALMLGALYGGYRILRSIFKRK